MDKNFLYLDWQSTDRNSKLKFHEDERSSVEVMTSVGPYKNNYAKALLEDNNVYCWEVKIIRGNYFKIGIMKKSGITSLKGTVFSDSIYGFAYYSIGELRNGSNSTGSKFGKGYGPGDIIKVCYNSNQGKLYFGKNGEQVMEAFSHPDLKKGGYVPAVGTLIEGSKYCLTIPQLED